MKSSFSVLILKKHPENNQISSSKNDYNDSQGGKDQKFDSFNGGIKYDRAKVLFLQIT